MAALLLTLITPAVAGALGNPARTPESGVVEAQLSASVSNQAMSLQNDPSCTDYCVASDKVSGPALRVNLHPANFVGLWAEATWGSDYLNGTDHLASGLGLAVGGHLTLPGRGLRPALSGRARWMSTAAEDTDGALLSENRALMVEGALLGVVGDDVGGANGWFGPIATVWGGNDAALYYTEGGQQLRYTPYFPVGAVLGGELISAPTAQYLKRRSPRVTAGLELRMIDAWGASAWLGLSY